MTSPQPSHVLLLRGINVGGKHKLPMADARRVLTEAGFADVTSYIQSGNLVLTSDDGPDEVARRARAALEQVAGFPIPTLVLSGAELHRILAENPYRPELPRLEHVVVLPHQVDAELRTRLEALARADESSSELTVGRREVYLHHPEGLLQSTLATRATAMLTEGTARNLATLTKLSGMIPG